MEFCAEVKDGCSLGLFVQLPFDVYVLYGTHRQKVWAELNGLRFPAVLQRVGRPEYVLVFRSEVRKALKLKAGEQVHIRLEVRS